MNDIVDFRYCKRFHYMSDIQHTAYIMHEVSYNGWTSHANNCRIQPDGLLYDTERNLLAIAKFL